MDKAIVKQLGIAAAIVLAALLGLFMIRAATSAGNTARTSSDKDVTLSQQLEDDLCDSYDRKTTSGAQIVGIIEDAAGYSMRIRVQADTQGGKPVYDYYIYANDDLSRSSDNNDQDMISRARRSISGTTLYVGTEDVNANGDVIGLTFNFAK